MVSNIIHFQLCFKGGLIAEFLPTAPLSQFSENLPVRWVEGTKYSKTMVFIDNQARSSFKWLN